MTFTPPTLPEVKGTKKAFAAAVDAFWALAEHEQDVNTRHDAEKDAANQCIIAIIQAASARGLDLMPTSCSNADLLSRWGGGQ